MGRLPIHSIIGVEDQKLNKGPWTEAEDAILSAYVKAHGEGNWRKLPKLAGLARCRKSCRLRWINYLRPDLKRGNFSADEDELIIKLHDLLGNRWSLIAGRLPGRTDNEIKNYWNTRLKKKVSSVGGNVLAATPLGFSSEASDGYSDGDLQNKTRATTDTNSSPQLIVSTNLHNFNSGDMHIGSDLHHQDMSSYAVQTPPDSCWSEQYSSSPAQSDNSTFTPINMDFEKYGDPFLELQRTSNSKNTDDSQHDFYTQSPESGLCYPDYSSTSTSSPETNLGFPQGENLENKHLQSAFDDQQHFDDSLGLESLDFLVQQEFESNRWSALQLYLDSL